jgi:8-amino-7-oxononanoate synthase
VDKFAKLNALLQQQQQQQLYRRTRLAETAQQPQRIIDGKALLTFCSNDYLGLANHPAVIHAFQQAANQYGVGSGAAHLVNGHSKLHQQLEEALAEFTGREQALLFSTGYMANLGVTNALVGRHDFIYADKLNHASLVDAALLSGAKVLRYPHNDTAHLAKRLQHTEQTQLMLTDGVFSMDGDVAPMQELAKLAQQANAWLMVDDAHGLGVLGQTGAGLVEQAQLSAVDVPILMGTLGKALGTAGAFVAGDWVLIEYLKQTARSWIFTTAQPPAIAAATLASLALVQQGQHLREHLQQLIRQFRQGAQQLGLTLMDSQTPIQPIILGSNTHALAASAYLESQGILVTAIRPPTVPQGTARLRVTLSAAHTALDVERLLAALAQLPLKLPEAQ